MQRKSLRKHQGFFMSAFLPACQQAHRDATSCRSLEAMTDTSWQPKNQLEGMQGLAGFALCSSKLPAICKGPSLGALSPTCVAWLRCSIHYGLTSQKRRACSWTRIDSASHRECHASSRCSARIRQQPTLAFFPPFSFFLCFSVFLAGGYLALFIQAFLDLCRSRNLSYCHFRLRALHINNIDRR